MKFAAIDIGSNAVRLLLSNVNVEGPEPVFETSSLIRVPVRLGDDAFMRGHISDVKKDQLLQAMKEFRVLIDAFMPLDSMACATSAMREADNSESILQAIKDESGIELRVISGSEEAQMIYASHCEKVIASEKNSDVPSSGPYLHIDVGGGSTELILYDRNLMIAYNSFNIGAIRMMEELVTKVEWDRMKDWVRSIVKDFHPGSAVGSGGNISKVFSLANGKDGFPMSYADMKRIYELLRSQTIEQRISKMGLKPDRADVIVPALKIYMSVMKWGGLEQIHVPQLGLVDGIVRVLYEKHKQSDMIVVHV